MPTSSPELPMRHTKLDAALATTSRLRRAAVNVLGNSAAGRSIIDRCDDHTDALQMIAAQRTADYTSIAVIGATGQGKTWLIRQLIQEPNVRNALLSGDSQAEATRSLIWIGPRAPAGIDSRWEQYHFCSTESMLDLGGAYLVVDTPGATDLDPQTADAATRAIHTASVVILVVRRQQVRSEVPGRLAAVSDGTLIVPVITAVRTEVDDAALRSDVDALANRLRSAAPHSEVLDAVLVSDFALADQDEEQIGRQAAQQLTIRLQTQLAGGDFGHRRRALRVASLQERFLNQVRSELAEHVPRLSNAIEHLEKAVVQLPHDVAVELIGSGPVLRAAVRSRLRAEVMVGTAALWFPYRTLLGLLNLTQGAWDRLILALSGSLPSLIGVTWTSVRNWQQNLDQAQAANSVRQRCNSLINDQIAPLVNRFRRELQRLKNAPVGEPNGDNGNELAGAQMLGIDSLQSEAQRIFEQQTIAAAPSGLTMQMLGFLGTLLFWALLAGPIVALYHAYFGASFETIGQGANNLDHFPHPHPAMILTSLLLSLLPTSIMAMLELTWIQSRGRQERAASQIDQGIKGAIERMQVEGVLRLEFHDPLLDDARCLLKASEQGDA